MTLFYKMITIAALVASLPAFGQGQVLKFKANKTFKIVQFTDLHYVPFNDTLRMDTAYMKKVEASKDALENEAKVLDIEKPDLVIITGDIAWHEPAKQALLDVLKPILDRKLKFAITWGNHDHEQDLTNAQLQAIVEALPGNVGIDDKTVEGQSDFVLPILGKNLKPAFLLYGFDSHAYSSFPQVKGYDWIKKSQIDAYQVKSAHYTKANGNKPLPALAFFHIPLPEYNLAAADESAFLFGYRGETSCAPKINTGLFAAMLNAGDVMGLFVGHDHNNNYITEYKGLSLGYGAFSGGKTVYFDLPCGNGGRVITLTEGERGYKTWIRLHTGQQILPYHKRMKK